MIELYNILYNLHFVNANDFILFYLLAVIFLILNTGTVVGIYFHFDLIY